MAKAKRERRASIRTMQTDNGALDLLDRLDALEVEEAARRAGGDPESETEPADTDAPGADR